jgi:hypothetical protein
MRNTLTLMTPMRRVRTYSPNIEGEFLYPIRFLGFSTKRRLRNITRVICVQHVDRALEADYKEHIIITKFQYSNLDLAGPAEGGRAAPRGFAALAKSAAGSSSENIPSDDE